MKDIIAKNVKPPHMNKYTKYFSVIVLEKLIVVSDERRIVMPELYTCKDCGKPTNNKHVISLMNGEDLIIHRCDNCKEKLSAEIEWENEQFREDDIICPWCGEHFSDYEDMSQVVENPYEESEGKVKCLCCEKEFELEIETVCYYTTRKPSEQFDYEAYLQQKGE